MITKVIPSTLRVAPDVQKLIGPVAGMGAVVVSESFLASDFFGLAVSASVVVDLALVRGLEQAKGVLANRIRVAARSGGH